MTENPTDSVQLCLDRLMLAYRSCPHVGTGEVPALHSLSREPTTKLDLARPILQDQPIAGKGGSGGRKAVRFRVGELVWVRSYMGNTQ